MNILVDTSVWVDYFREGILSQKLDSFIDENTIVTNHLILAELLPFLRIKKQRKLIEMLQSISNIELLINWGEIIEFQYLLLKAGINGIGIPDLIIFQNAKTNRCPIFSFDSHFRILSEMFYGELISK